MVLAFAQAKAKDKPLSWRRPHRQSPPAEVRKRTGVVKLKPFDWPKLALVSSVLRSGLAAVHMSDDFLWNVPAKLRLSVPATLWLAYLWLLSLVGLTVAAAVGSRTGHLEGTIAAVLILAAQLLKSLPEILLPGSWHAGLTSESLAVALALSAGLTSASSWVAWRSFRQVARRPRDPGARTRK